MTLCRHRLVGIAVAAAALLVCLTARAQSTLTPQEALSYRRIASVHISPDGLKFAYIVYSYEWDWRPHLWLMDLPSGQSRQLTSTGKSDRAPEWSGHGPALAFLSDRGGKTQVYVAGTKGDEAAAVTTRKYGVRSFHWPPDGRSIAYLAKDDAAADSDEGPQVADSEGDLARLWVVTVASGLTRRVGLTGYRIDQFQWQDSAHLLIVATDRPRTEEWNDAVYRVSLSGDELTPVSHPPQPFSGLIVSPDGKQFSVKSTRAAGPDPREDGTRSRGTLTLNNDQTQPTLDPRFLDTASRVTMRSALNRRHRDAGAAGAAGSVELLHNHD